MHCKVECLISFELHLSSCCWTRRKVVNDDFSVAVELWEVVLRLKLEVGTSWVICTKGGGLVSMNEIFTVVCSIVESVFENRSRRKTEWVKKWMRTSWFSWWLVLVDEEMWVGLSRVVQSYSELSEHLPYNFCRGSWFDVNLHKINIFTLSSEHLKYQCRGVKIPVDYFHWPIPI